MHALAARVETGEPRKLNLGCGSDVKPGYLNADAYPVSPEVQRLDFTSVPWPFRDGQFEEVYMRHSIEHVPPVFEEDEEGVKVDVLVRVVEEVHRVLADGGRWVILTPLGTSELGPSHWQHYRFLTPDWFRFWNQAHPEARPYRYNFEVESVVLNPWQALGDRFLKVNGLGLTLHLAKRSPLLRRLLATHVEMVAVLRKLPMPPR